MNGVKSGWEKGGVRSGWGKDGVHEDRVGERMEGGIAGKGVECNAIVLSSLHPGSTIAIV